MQVHLVPQTYSVRIANSYFGVASVHGKCALLTDDPGHSENLPKRDSRCTHAPTVAQSITFTFGTKQLPPGFTLFVR